MFSDRGWGGGVGVGYVRARVELPGWCSPEPRQGSSNDCWSACTRPGNRSSLILHNTTLKRYFVRITQYCGFQNYVRVFL